MSFYSPLCSSGRAETGMSLAAAGEQCRGVDKDTQSPPVLSSCIPEVRSSAPSQLLVLEMFRMSRPVTKPPALKEHRWHFSPLWIILSRVVLGPMTAALLKVTWWTSVLCFVSLAYLACNWDRTHVSLPHRRQPSSSPQHLWGFEHF